MRIILLAVLLAVSGCASQQTKQLCLTTHEITLTDAEIDALSAETARQILAFDKARREICGKQ